MLIKYYLLMELPLNGQVWGMCHDTQYLLLCYQRLIQNVSELQQVILSILVLPVLAHCLLFLPIFCRFLEHVTSHFYLIDKWYIYIFCMLVMVNETIVCFPVRSAERDNRLFSRKVVVVLNKTIVCFPVR